MSDEFDDADADEPRIKPRVSVLTALLCLLNVGAAVGFAVLLLMNYEKRQAWSYSVFLHDLALMGLPLEMEADFPSASREMSGRQRLDPAQLKAAFQARRTGAGVSEPFQSVDEILQARIKPQHLSEETLKEIFKGLDPPVTTLEQEIRRLIKDLPGDLDKAAKELAGLLKTDDQKKQVLRDKLLLPLASNTEQVEKLKQTIDSAQGPTLDLLVEEALMRRLVIDILAPLDVFRPGDVEDRSLFKIADGEIKIGDFQDVLKRRLESAIAEKYDPALYQGKEWTEKIRDSIEKREVIAYTLFAIAQVKKPDGLPLYPKGAERVQVVVGQQEYAAAAQAYAKAMRVLESRVLDLIATDREGKSFVDVAGEVKGRTEGFVDKHHREIQRIRAMFLDLQERQARLKDLQDQNQRYQKILADRQQQHDDIVKQLLAARDLTMKLQQEVRRLQSDVFRAQVELSDAAARNYRLEEQIRYHEAVQRGGKLP